MCSLKGNGDVQLFQRSFVSSKMLNLILVATINFSRGLRNGWIVAHWTTIFENTGVYAAEKRLVRKILLRLMKYNAKKSWNNM